MLTVLIVVVALVLFLLVIMIHEFGHFIFAKSFGVKVNEFAVGMGPKLFSKKKGETTYSFRMLPIGGFCAMEGEDENSNDERALNNKKVWQRIIIVVAGALFNIILGFIFMLILQAQEPYYASRTIANFLPTLVTEAEYLENADSETKYYFTQEKTTDNLMLIVSDEEYVSGSDVITYSMASKLDGYYYREAMSGESGLQINDEIHSVNGYRALCFYDAYFAMSLDDDGVMDFVVVRDGEKITLKDVRFERVAASDSAYANGMETTVLDFQVYGVKRTFGTVLQSSLLQSQYCIRSVYVSLWRLVTGQSGMNELSGPVGIAAMIGEVAEAGFAESFISGINNILYVMAIIAFNLGIVNLLPLPALDGGRLVFLIIEAIRRKPINPKYEGIVHMIGLFLLFALMIVIAYSDIVKLVSSCMG